MILHNIIRNHPSMKDYPYPIMDLINEGKVKVNGKTMRRNRSFVIERDNFEVFLDDSWVTLDHHIRRTLLAMYKPRGYLCTHHDDFGRDKIYDLLPDKWKKLRSVGRLDQDSEGLLLLTDDGYFLFGLTSPKFPCEKKYLVGLPEQLPDQMITESLSGTFEIIREGEIQVLRPVKILPVLEDIKSEFEYLQLEKKYHWYEFTLTEGRYNQIRKMCKKYNLEVQRLIRIQHEKYRLNREIFESQINIIQNDNKG